MPALIFRTAALATAIVAVPAIAQNAALAASQAKMSHSKPIGLGS